MKLSKNWKRIFAGVMAAIMVFLSIDAGCMTALAAEIQELNNGKNTERPTGYLDLEQICVDGNVFEGGIHSYEELAEIQLFTDEETSEWYNYSNYFFYNQMSDDWRKVWDALDLVCLDFLSYEIDAFNQEFEGSVYYFLEAISLPENVTSDELMTFIELFLNSNPQYYYLNNAFLVSSEETAEGKVPVAFTLCVYEKFALGTDRTQATVAFQTAIDAVFSTEEFSKANSEAEKLQYVHDYIVKNVEYNDVITTDDEETTDVNESEITDLEDKDAISQSAYSALCMNTTVCAGYAEALQLLCNALGIDTICVTSEDHQWNKVYINHTWYNVDSTWADAGKDNPIYYDYYLRSDDTYHDRTDAQYRSHIECSFYGNYSPACPLDVLPVNDWEAPGTLPEISKQTDPPKFNVLKAGINEETGEQRYMIHMQPDSLIYNVSNPAECYYTLDGTNPSLAKEKSFRYRSPIYVEGDYYIKVKVVQSGFLDSEVVVFTNQVDVPVVENPVINDHFYNKMTLQWDEVEEATGYVLNIYKGTETLDSNIIKTVAIENKETTSYVLDTSAYGAGENIFFEIYAYAGEGENQVLSDKTTSQFYKTKSAPLNAEVEWHVATIENVKYLVIDVKEIVENVENAQDELILWYFTNESKINPDCEFKVDVSDGTTRFMYTYDVHGVAYDETGYIYISNADKTSAFQEESYIVGGEYVVPELLPITDVTKEHSDDVITLHAAIKEDTRMENFHYIYQWYEAPDEISTGTKIEGATKNTYQPKVGSFEEKFYYCEVTALYEKENVYTSSNGDTNEAGNKVHTRVSGELFGTKVNISEIKDQIFTGTAITPELIITDENTGTVLEKGKDYTVSYSDNVNAKEKVEVLVTFIGDYENTPSAIAYFNIKAKNVEKNEDSISLYAVDNVIYTGTAFAPKGNIVDVDREVTLVEGVDYNISFSNNTNVGTGVVTIDFIGNYTGTCFINFKISPREIRTGEVTISNNIPRTYAGYAIIPDLMLTLGEKTLVDGTDYKLECTNNTNAGTANVIIRYIGNYSGTDTTQFTIVKKSADDLMIEAIEDQEYSGHAITPTLKVVYANGSNAVVLTEGADYIATYSENIDLGEATVTLTFKVNYTGTRTVCFNIVAKNASNLSYEPIDDQIYTGEEITPVPVVKNGNISLVAGADYDLVYENNVDVGEDAARVIMNFKGNYTGSKTLNFKILPKEAKECTIEFEIPNQIYSYNGKEIKPSIIVKDGNKVLEEGKDYTVEYSKNKYVGKAEIKVSFKGNYTGETIVNFSIISKSITAADLLIGGLSDQIFNGSEIIPDITIMDKSLGELLREGIDFVVSVINNIMAGMATVKIEFLSDGNYMGQTIIEYFMIEPRDTKNVVISDIPDQRYTGNPVTPELEINDGDIELVYNQDYTVEFHNNVNEGQAKVIVSFKGNFTGDPVEKTFNIIDSLPTEITSETFHISQDTGYISKITVGTTVQTLWSHMNEKDYVVVLDKNGNLVTGETALCTGMKACIMDEGTVTRSYTIIVTGDTNGDGKINITDMIAVKACSLKKSDLAGAYEKAADVNGDGKINITDFIKVKATTLKKDTITGVAVN